MNENKYDSFKMIFFKIIYTHTVNLSKLMLKDEEMLMLMLLEIPYLRCGSTNEHWLLVTGNFLTA